jgi:hypothetical protein
MEMKSNIICINLTHFNHVKLAEVCKIYNLEYEAMWFNKKSGIGRFGLTSQVKQR